MITVRTTLFTILPALAVVLLSGCSAAGPPVALRTAQGESIPVEAVEADVFREAVGQAAAAGPGATDDPGATDEPGRAENAGADSSSRASGDPSTSYYLFDPPLSLDGPRSAVLLSTGVLPAGTQLALFGDAGGVTVPAGGVVLSAPAGDVAVTGLEQVIHPGGVSTVSALSVTTPAGWELPEDAGDRPVVTVGAAAPFLGAELADRRLRLGSSSTVSISRAASVDWTVELPPDTEGGRLEIDYAVADSAPADPVASVEVSGGGRAVSYRARLARPGGTIAIPGPALGFTPRRVRVASADQGVSVQRVEWHTAIARAPGATVGSGAPGAAAAGPAAPIPADLATILSGYPRSAWRRDDFEVFAWAAYPRILVFDTADYGVQSRLFRRLAFFVEKRGFRGRLLSDAELGGRHGWNAHNYRPEGLAPFFTEAEAGGFELNAEEQELRGILLANGIIRRTGSGYEPGEGGILSISQQSYPLLRELLITHEAYHGLFYEEAGFREDVAAVWNGLSDAERSYWRGLLSYMTYDPADEYLMINEFQAYVLQQPLERARGYLRGVLAPRYARARPAQRESINRFLEAYPDTFVRSARLVEEVLRRYSPFAAGDVLLLLPADGEA